MKHIEDDQLAKQLLEAIRGEVDQPRDPDAPEKIHLTELIYCLTLAWFKRQITGGVPPTDREVLLYASGIGTEKMLLQPHKQQIRMEVDGINCTSDFLTNFGVGNAEHDLLPGEMKVTRISTATVPKTLAEHGYINKGWTLQILGYMKALSKTFQTSIREMMLVMFHLMGGYNPPFPTLKVWRLTASDEEVDTTWEWFKMRRDVLEVALDTGQMPTPYKYNDGESRDSWECKECRLKVVCEATTFIAAQKGA